MSLPRKLKNMNLFNEGSSYLGEIASLTIPELGRSMEEFRGGGMNGPVKIDNGMNAIDLEWTCSGLVVQVLRQFGAVGVAAVMLRFAGSYQRDDTGAVDAVEVVVRGRHETIAFGEQKPGEDTEMPVNTACAYYKLSINGRTEIEIDFLNMVEIVGGVDRMATHRRAIGL